MGNRGDVDRFIVALLLFSIKAFLVSDAAVSAGFHAAANASTSAVSTTGIT